MFHQTPRGGAVSCCRDSAVYRSVHVCVHVYCEEGAPTAAGHSRYREAELKHGRVAMLAAAGMITADKFHPLFNGKLSANPLLAFIQVGNPPRFCF